MKFILFYAFYECRRKPLRFLAVLMTAGITLFCMTTLTALLAGSAGAQALAGRQSEARFASATYALILTAHLLFLLTGTALLTLSKLQQNACEYGILHDLGVGKDKMFLLQLCENTAAFLLAAAAAVPLACAFMRSFTDGINRKLQRTVLTQTVPTEEMFLSVALLFAALLLGTTIPCIRKAHPVSIKADGVFDEQRPVIKMFSTVIHRRCKAQRRAELAIMALIQLLPLIFLIAAASSGAPAEPTYDCYISVNEETNTPIPETILRDVKEIAGIQTLDVIPSSFWGAGFYSSIKIKFNSAGREAGLQAVQSIPAIGSYRFTNTFHSIQQAAMQNLAYRQLYLLIAGALMLAVLPLLAVIESASWEAHSGSMAVFYTLGLDNRAIRQYYRHESLYTALRSSLLAIFSAALLFSIMEIEGGGSLPLKEIGTAGLGYFGLQLLLAQITAHLAYRRFLRVRLHKTFADQEEWHAYHL